MARGQTDLVLVVGDIADGTTCDWCGAPATRRDASGGTWCSDGCAARYYGVLSSYIRQQMPDGTPLCDICEAPLPAPCGIRRTCTDCGSAHQRDSDERWTWTGSLGR